MPADLNPRIKGFLVDLRYRGDYHPKTRELIQHAIVSNSIPMLKTAYLTHKDAFGGANIGGRHDKRISILNIQ